MPGELSTSGTGGINNNIGYNGAVYNRESNLYSMRFREYHPLRGRWLQRDPAGYMDSSNLYGYVAGNPIGWTDPLGLQAQPGGDVWYSSDPGQFGSAGVGFSGDDFSGGGLIAGTGLARLIPLGDLWWLGALIDTGVRHHRMSREEVAAERMWGWVSMFQDILDVAGEIPVLGVFFDGLNAAIYLAKGDLRNAIISGAAIIIPGAAGVRMMFRNADEAAAMPTRLQRAADNGGVTIRRSDGGDINLPLHPQHHPECFVAGTNVATPQGQTPIEQIEAGDEVWSFNIESGEWEKQVVEGTSNYVYHGEMIAVTIRAEDGSYDTIMATAAHPFWVAGGADLAERPQVDFGQERDNQAIRGRWIEARGLRIGDEFVTRSGRAITVVDLSVRFEHVRVYNLNVPKLHNFSVGHNEILVHNVCPGNRLKKPQDAHIVPQGMRAYERGEISIRMRNHLAKNGIHVDDPLNMFLAYDTTHMGTHRKGFLRWLEDTIGHLHGEALRTKMGRIKRQLDDGSFELPDKYRTD